MSERAGDLAAPRSWFRGAHQVSTDPARLDFAVIHGYLTRSYWSPGIERAQVERAARHSVCYGLYGPPEAAGSRPQIGYARVVTDHVSFAYLADVFVLEGHRGGGLGSWLVECAVQDPEFAGVRRFLLFTRDAHALYRRFGFAALPSPDRAMMRPGAGPA